MWPIKVHYLRWLSSQLENINTRCIQMGESYGAHTADYEIAKELCNTELAEYHKKKSEMYFRRMKWYKDKYISNLLTI